MPLSFTQQDLTLLSGNFEEMRLGWRDGVNAVGVSITLAATYWCAKMVCQKDRLRVVYVQVDRVDLLAKLAESSVLGDD
ncbi:hypothetical protein [Alteromonas hispanica]|uniref:Uncharacterized protein n=1 Tax=Alteromonas hispanica TaxID=315421 RepID=A0A6L9MUB2_9ALTE|nr:hypothetical protein [Alteromonas hispanica]NDW21852.1 hypothetical protein [Alteromonas hispanica]